ncbi:WecB/TagA/CpsF family glycosyltransferase [Gloeocapsa sp. PCC 73106]|uniref:WecB/TagA/CpsF family glycosyltransferase n=1 Tax=Gloeocapsa sp. PCC 73106 TaxID=102232 RepID=UPI0002AD0B69|nr:WecB/TagA/CpsF family glycosyltransferase [Gloeocapsa sp. PCC 73106]ELR96243.1 exopolysaccharide biosynthesis protein, WecB/TagA/CpsF family [Gloeocapsa sp. PCC 73106]
MTQPNRIPVLKVAVDSLEDYSNWVLNRIKHEQGTQVTTLNAEMAMLAETNSELRAIINQSDLIIPDGAGIIIYLRLRGYRQARCPGIELAASLLKAWSTIMTTEAIAFYGGEPGIAEDAASMWLQQYPHLKIITNHGYLTHEAANQWQNTLVTQQPKLILVGLGVPRQEFWINQHRHLCPQSIWMGVGGSFDIWAGKKSRAPLWLRENNLEWLYRLYQEPWRWRRMLALPQFLLRALS